jgi:iron(III) transport system substrate-binding protein
METIILRLSILSAFLLLAGWLGLGMAQDLSRPDDDIFARAKQEKELVIYGVVDADFTLSDVVAAFRRRYPFIHIVSATGGDGPPYERFRREVSAGRPSADFIWNLAMDMQEKFINDGYSLPYASRESKFLQPWAHWQDLGYGIGQVPVAFVYNRRFLSPNEMPKTHAALKELLRRQPSRFRGRVAIYDPETSDLGMLLLSQDARVTPDNWGLFDAFGTVDARNYRGSREILRHILSGDQWIGYDVVSSFAVEMQKTHPELVIVYPSDYALLISRVAFISATAPHPDTAKLFLNYLLSREGQGILQQHGLGTVRTDMMPQQAHRADPLRTQAIRLGPGLLSNLDSLVRAQFLRRWSQSRSTRTDGGAED